MARVTVDDCLSNVDNRFELVLIASKRARQLAREGADPLVPSEGDKATVIALREIATGLIDKHILDEHRPLPKLTTLLATELAAAEDATVISQEIINETQQTETESQATSQTSVSLDGDQSEEE